MHCCCQTPWVMAILSLTASLTTSSTPSPIQSPLTQEHSNHNDIGHHASHLTLTAAPHMIQRSVQEWAQTTSRTHTSDTQSCCHSHTHHMCSDMLHTRFATYNTRHRVTSHAHGRTQNESTVVETLTSTAVAPSYNRLREIHTACVRYRLVTRPCKVPR
jgi:hypothetical protein